MNYKNELSQAALLIPGAQSAADGYRGESGDVFEACCWKPPLGNNLTFQRAKLVSIFVIYKYFNYNLQVSPTTRFIKKYFEN